jgi:predicted glycogen debranching enzyme
MNSETIRGPVRAAPHVVRAMQWDAAHASRELLLEREWLVTNGLGGYASGTVSGAITRRYHGLLTAALPAPRGRMVMWSHVSEVLHFDGKSVSLGSEERAGGQLDLHGADYLTEFRLEDGLPVWVFRIGDLLFEKRVLLLHLQNTVHLTYRILEGTERPRLELKPAVHFRHYESPVDKKLTSHYKLSADRGCYEIAAPEEDLPPLRLQVRDADYNFTIAASHIRQVIYRSEQLRGYEHEGDLWSPGFFVIDLCKNESITLIGSTEPWEIIKVLSPREARAAEEERRARLLVDAVPEAQHGFAAELVLAADQFIITPAGRAEEAARAHASGDEVRTIIAGYHWFTDWGRDTMISLEGLALVTGRCLEAGYILRTFAHYVRDGLIPNMFPDAEKEGRYHTADATLWFFHALSRYLARAEDHITLRLLLPILVDIADHHLRGTRFNIHVDATDGLLYQGAEGYQLTWMDAKMGDWVVTPRRGKAVEINALWFNALKLLAAWLASAGDRKGAARFDGHAERARHSFNRRFWFEDGGYLYDVVDCPKGQADDTSCRPNQLLAISLEHPVLDERYWGSVLDVVKRELLTPAGLRSLSPNDPDYKPVYSGDLRSRDGAYHQGTVWAWLIGPYIDSWLKLHPGERAAARQLLDGFAVQFDQQGLGTISEVFDAEKPHTPRGCIAQAWSVAEVLRCWLKTS